MFMRDENLIGSIDGVCASCKTEQDIAFKEEWCGRNLYMVGTCPDCEYEHHISLDMRTED